MEQTLENCDFGLKDENVKILRKNTDNVIKSNKCNQCDYASSHAGNLRAHLKKHSGEIAFHIYCNSRYDNRKLFKVYPSGEISYVFISDKCMQKPFLVVRSIQLQLGEGRARVWLNLGKFAK